MDPVDEKSSMLSRAGSFYYNVLSESNRKTVHRLSHLSCNCRVFRQLANSSDLVLSGGYFDDHWKVIRFKDSQVIYYGVEDALQKRYSTSTSTEVGMSRPDHLTVEDSFLPVTDKGKGLTEYGDPLIFPGGDEDAELPATYQMRYGLIVDPDIYVTSIELADGTLMLQNLDFQAQFGLINFYEHPTKIFGGMKFMAKSYIYRRRNLYSYTLQLDDVYGPVDRVMTYYRKIQSPRALYYAAAQAAGMPVIRTDCKILGVMPLHAGVAYLTDTGRYDAAFPHTHLKVGTRLTAGTVIGGSDLFELYGPNDPLPNNLEYINLDNAIPVKGLRAPNKEGIISSTTHYLSGETETTFCPALEGDAEAVKRYHEYIKKWSTRSSANEASISVQANAPSPPQSGTPYSVYNIGNIMLHYLHEVARNRYILIRINEDAMTSDMKLRLHTFLDRERPLGSVLLSAPLNVTIVEEL